ncbi:DUF4880 domain-containing protein [Caulobacter segnis]
MSFWRFDRPRGSPAEPRDAAALWAARRRLGLTSPRDEARFEAWLANPANAAAFAKTEAPLEIAGDLAGAEEILALREAALSRYPARRSRPTAMLVAAAAVLSRGHGGPWRRRVAARTTRGCSRPQGPRPPPRRRLALANATPAALASG